MSIVVRAAAGLLPNLPIERIAVGHRRAVVRAVLLDEVAAGRVEHDGDRYRVVVDAFPPDVLLALRELTPSDATPPRAARRTTMSDELAPVWSGAVHPAALIFPLMGDDELDDLAADIRERGLISPLQLHPETGELLDGRNRLEACQRANVEPRFETAQLNSSTPLDYVVSMNVIRRNLSVGQIALAAAKAWDLYAVKQGRPPGKSARSEQLSTREIVASVFGVGVNAVQQARALLQRDPVAAEAVLVGTTTLPEAFEALRQREREREAYERRLATLAADIAGDDLVERVRDGRLALPEAEAIARERHERVDVWVGEIRAALSLLVPMAGGPLPTEFKELLDEDEYATLAFLLDALATRTPAA
jgi:ParB-like chromosome segregation protein Spo0J